MSINDDDITTTGAPLAKDPRTAAPTRAVTMAARTDPRTPAKDPPTAARTPAVTTAAPTDPPTPAKDPPTAAPTPAVTTAAPTDPLERGRVSAGRVDRPALARLTGTLRGRLQPRPLGRAAASHPARQDGFDDLFSADAADELVAERGLRTPFARMAAEGTVLSSSLVHGVGRLRRRGRRPARLRRRCSSSSPAARRWSFRDCIARGSRSRRSPGSSSRTSVTPPRSTPTSRRRPRAGSIRTTTPTTCSSSRSPVRSAGRSMSRCTGIRWPTSRGRITATRSPSGHATAPRIDAVFEPGDVLYLPRGWIHSAVAQGGTSIHLTIGVRAATRHDLLARLLARRGR